MARSPEQQGNETVVANTATAHSDSGASMPPPDGVASSEEPVSKSAGETRASVKRKAPGVVSRAILAFKEAIGELFNGGGMTVTILRRSLAVVLGILAWHYAVEHDFKFIINFENVSSPLEVFEAFEKHLASSKFYVHIGASLQRIVIAYGLAAVLGIVLGLAMGRSRLAYDLVLPYVEILRPIPAVAWIPLAILMWPTEESSIIYITFLGALFPIILSTVAGVQQTPEVLVRAARSLGARRLQIFRHVVLPAALPNIATGLSVGMGVAWFSLLAGEIISGQYGIGYFTWTAYHLIKYADIIVGMLTIGLLGSFSTMGVQMAAAPFLKWQRKSR